MKKVEKRKIETLTAAVLALAKEEYILTRIELANMIKETIQQNNRSIADISRQLGIDYDELRAIINVRDIKLTDLIKIAGCFNMGIDISFCMPRVSDAGAMAALREKVIKTKEITLEKEIKLKIEDGKEDNGNKEIRKGKEEVVKEQG